MWLLDKFLRRLIRNGALQVTDHDGRIYRYGDPEAEPLAIRLTRRGVAAHLARYPKIGAGEAYMDGGLVIEPPHDIRDFVLFVTAQATGARTTLGARSVPRQALDRIAFRLDQRNTRARASRNARHHYDLSRQFYELFLDADRQYTMAYYADPADTLERAQLAKKALIAAKLRISADTRVLDIGCGWGGLALYLHRHYGCEVVGVSLAPDQVAFARERAQAAGVADKVRFELMDYRDIAGSFDRIVSVGMIEHVGADRFGEYFAKCHQLLSPDGIALTHTIGRAGGPGTTDAFTRKYIFPGGYIPALSELQIALERAGWRPGDIETLRFHYGLTLAEWYRRTCAHEGEITALYDARLFRMWQFYLAGAEQAFSNGKLVNYHIQAAKRTGALPMTRDYIAAEMARLLAADGVTPQVREATK